MLKNNNYLTKVDTSNTKYYSVENKNLFKFLKIIQKKSYCMEKQSL